MKALQILYVGMISTIFYLSITPLVKVITTLVIIRVFRTEKETLRPHPKPCILIACILITSSEEIKGAFTLSN